MRGGGVNALAGVSRVTARRPTHGADRPRGDAGRVLRMHWPGGPDVVAKLYTDDSGAQAFVTQRVLAAQVGPDACPLRIPGALHYSGASRVVVQAPAYGADVSARLRAGDADVLVDAGRAVARLHSLRPPSPDDLPFDELVALLMRPHPRDVGRAIPSVAARIDRVLAVLAQSVPAPGMFRAAVHRDLHPRQMLADGRQIWIVDWDLAGAGDPALDLGNLVGWLETHLPAGLAARCRERFLFGYAEFAGAAAFARLDLYRAFTFMRLASKRFRLGDDPQTRVLPMIALAESTLEGRPVASASHR